jgi:hypothetical protein
VDFFLKNKRNSLSEECVAWLTKELMEAKKLLLWKSFKRFRRRKNKENQIIELTETIVESSERPPSTSTALCVYYGSLILALGLSLL